MQIKKEEVREAIVTSATNEFYEHGFEKASLRTIAKKAGTTIGNFYNYFPNKEAVYSEIVKDAHDLLTLITSNHNALEGNDALWDISDASVWRDELTKLIQGFLPMFNKAFIILIIGSKGTVYEGSKDIFKQLLAEHFIEHIEAFKPDYPHHEMADVLAEQLLTGLISIIRTHEDPDTQQRLIIEYILFYAIGSMGILQ